jgi:hypothetical protein
MFVYFIIPNLDLNSDHACAMPVLRRCWRIAMSSRECAYTVHLAFVLFRPFDGPLLLAELSIDCAYSHAITRNLRRIMTRISNLVVPCSPDLYHSASPRNYRIPVIGVSYER